MKALLCRRSCLTTATLLTLALSGAGSAWAQADRLDDELVSGLEVNASNVLDWQQNGHPIGFGTISAALAITQCQKHCLKFGGFPSNFGVSIDGGPGDWTSDAAVTVGGNTASATGSLPSTVVTSSTYSYTIDNLSADTFEAGAKGSTAAAGALGWDVLDFSGETSGQTGTLSLTLTLTTPSASDSYGWGGGCVSTGKLCNPLKGTTVNGSSPTVTITDTFSLTSSPLLVFDSLYAISTNNTSPTAAAINDAVLTLTLPSNVSFTSASGDGGSPVPLPDSLLLLSCGFAALGFMGFFRRRAFTG